MDAIDMYFLNRIRPDSPLMPRVVFPTTASGTGHSFPVGAEAAGNFNMCGCWGDTRALILATGDLFYIGHGRA